MTANVFDKLVAFNKDTTEAFVKSSTAAYKGFEELAKATQEVMTKTASLNEAAFKALLGVKSPTELADLQGKLTRESVETAIADSRKLAELANIAMTAAVEPLNARMEAIKELTPEFSKFTDLSKFAELGKFPAFGKFAA
jgi:phasin family protein